VALLKALIKHLLNTTLHIHVGETVRHNLGKSAEIMGTNPSYVANEVLRLLFRKGIAFKHWAGRRISSLIPEQLGGDPLTKTA